MARMLGIASLSLMLAGLGCATGGEMIDDGGNSGVGGAGGSGSGELCMPGEQDSCACPGDAEGIKECLADGSDYGACDCDVIVAPPSCGNAFCGPEEDCHSCPSDCGTCAPCDEAPACANAVIPPAAPAHVPEFDIPLAPMAPAAILARLSARAFRGDVGFRAIAAALAPASGPGEHPLVPALRQVFAGHPKAAAALRRQLGRAGLGAYGFRPLEAWEAVASAPAGGLTSAAHSGAVQPKSGEFPGGTEECGAPLLRMRIAKVIVHEEDDDYDNDVVYCSVTSEAATGGEIRVTPKTSNLDEGEEYSFSLDSGVIWGQAEPRTPGGNLLITYDCFEADSTEGYQNLIDSIGEAAEAVGGAAGDQGWIFTVIGAVASVVSDSLALDSDDHLFNATQVIPLDRQLELTNGRFWTVRRAGTHATSDWDWELRVEAWGCTEYGTL